MGSREASHSGEDAASVPSCRPSNSRWPARWLRLAISLVLIGLLVRYGAIDFASLKTVFSSSGPVILSLLCIFSAVLITIVRWGLLLRLQGVRLPLTRVGHIMLIGLFFGTFVPGGIGQDVVRAYYAAKEPNCSIGPALVSVIADRVLGTMGLLIAATIMLLANQQRLAALPGLEGITLFTFGATVGAVALLAVAVVLGYHPAFRRILRRLLKQSGSFARFLAPAIEAGRYYHNHLWGVLASLGMSVVVHGFMALAVVTLASALSFPGLTWREVGLASLLSYLANGIPLTPGGLGVGEGVFDQICRFLTTAGAAYSYGTAFLSARMLGFAVGLLGLVSYVFHSDNRLFAGVGAIKLNAPAYPVYSAALGERFGGPVGSGASERGPGS